MNIYDLAFYIMITVSLVGLLLLISFDWKE